jgi:hypothetical protein
MRLILTIALLALPAASAAQPTAQSRAEILALPPGEAANVLLRGLAPRFVTMVSYPENDSSFLRILYFATAPESSGIAGLCQAKVLHVVLERSSSAAAPPIVRSFGLDDVYKVVGEVRGPGHFDEEAQARLCAASGPVVAQHPYEARGARFFHYSAGGLSDWLAVAALQGAIRTAREGRYGPIECARRALNDCRDPQAELAALDLRNLSSLQVVQPDPEQPNYHLRASFVVEPDESFPSGRRLWIMVNGEPLPGARVRRDTFNYGRTQLSRG